MYFIIIENLGNLWLPYFLLLRSSERLLAPQWGILQMLEDISCQCVFTIQKSMNSFHQFKFIPMRGGCFIALHYIICITLIIYITLHYYTLAMGKLCVMQSKMPRDYTLVTGEYTLWLKGKSSYRNHPDVKYRD